MKYFVGAYATSPSGMGWDPELETEYFNQLKAMGNVRGLEHPFVGKLHGEDDTWFLNNIDPNWEFVFTCVPGTMAALGKNPNFGIASDDAAGREEALAFMAAARDAIAQLNQHAGKPVVKAIEVQTAPNRANAAASMASLKASLTTMQSWDWQGARILIEHCDTYLVGQAPAKGFLTLREELAVLGELNQTLAADMGVVINWGRSVIETRTARGALDHIEQAKAAGLLAGLMFSGVTDSDNEYGAWKDTHMPAAKSAHGTIGADGSLMTDVEMKKCLVAAGGSGLPVLGIKLGVRPKDAPLADRLAYIRSALAILDAA